MLTSSQLAAESIDGHAGRASAAALPPSAPASLTSSELAEYRKLRAGGWAAALALAAVRRRGRGESSPLTWMGWTLDMEGGKLPHGGKLPPCVEVEGKAAAAYKVGKLPNGWVMIVRASFDTNPDHVDYDGMGHVELRTHDYEPIRWRNAPRPAARHTQPFGGGRIFLSRKHYRGDHGELLVFEPYDFYADVIAYRKQGLSRHDAWLRARSIARACAIDAARHYRGEAAEGCDFFMVEAEVYENEGRYARCIGSTCISGEYASAEEAVDEALDSYRLLDEALGQAHREQGERLIELG